MGIMEDFRKKLKSYHEEERKEEDEKVLENEEITEEEIEAIEQAYYRRKRFTGINSFARMYDPATITVRGQLNICNPIIRNLLDL